ncbi:MAG: hypothetical protein JSS83_25565 [Cyanobacteria bacterium SZAS LIN-3]|jgi:hypothetical protein|nr:hypothetical protein [Cyanobacteria bacterium SZAS LIN-3]
MKRTIKSAAREVPLPFSDGLLSAKLWQAHNRFVVGVPELGLSCYGNSETEASFRLFTTLIKYYRQLKAFKDRLNEKGRKDLVVLTRWMECIEDRITASPEVEEPAPAQLSGLAAGRTGRLLMMTPRLSR